MGEYKNEWVLNNSTRATLPCKPISPRQRSPYNPPTASSYSSSSTTSSTTLLLLTSTASTSTLLCPSPYTPRPITTSFVPGTGTDSLLPFSTLFVPSGGSNRLRSVAIIFPNQY